MSIRKLLAITALASATLYSVSAVAGDEMTHRIGGGIEMDTNMADVDDGFGPYLSYEIDLPEPISVVFDFSYITGDFDNVKGVAGKDTVSGTYTTMAVGAALLLQHNIGLWTPYFGAGGANHFNDFDNVNYDDKISMVWIVGTKLNIDDRMTAEASLRYSTLQVDSIDKEVRPNPLDMDAIIVRLGLVLDL